MIETSHQGPCLWMVCYKTSSDSYQTYWNVYPADTAEDATKQAQRDGTLRGAIHRWTVPYNAAGKTVEQTYAEYLAKTAKAAA